MRTLSFEFPEKEIYLLPIGDVHLGDKSFDKNSKKKLQGYIDWVKKTKNAYIFLMGDLLNTATNSSKSSPFQQSHTLNEQIALAVKLFEPVKHKILGAISGNHEQRMEYIAGYNPTIPICKELDIPYCDYSVVISFKIGKKYHSKKKKIQYRHVYSGYFHHTVGGGGTIGGKINRVDKLRQLVPNCDFYCGAHNHMLAIVHTVVFLHDKKNNKITEKRQLLVDCGGYIGWHESYAEAKQMVPLRIGSPKIWMSGKSDNYDVRATI